MRFSRQEVWDLFKSFIGVTFVFTIAIDGAFWRILPWVALFVGTAFLLHELAHKYMATYYKYDSQYVSNDFMMLVSMVIAVFGFIFIAPGGVVIAHVRKMKHLGIISLVGPLTNVLLGILCLTLIGVSPIFKFGFEINAWLALFNMIPIFGMDGQKILAWNRIVYFSFAGIVAALYMGTFFL